MNRHTHPIVPEGVPVPESVCKRSDYIKALRAEGFIPMLDAPSGWYMAHKDPSVAGVWVGWAFDGVFFVSRVQSDNEI